MKIGAWLYSYPPLRLLGAELMTSELLEALALAGHSCRVATIVDTRDYRRNGVLVSGRMIDLLGDRDSAPDVFVTHPELAEHCYHRARGYDAKMVGVVHNLRDETVNACVDYRWDLLVANSETTRAALAHVGVESIVIHPPTVVHKAPWPVRPRAITLVNMAADKGADTFVELARRMPDHDFLGVMGGYARQELDDLPRNITVVGQTGAMWMVYQHTRVLLMPSKHETWGRVGCEALALGIPVLASDLPGLRESLGHGARLLPVDDVDAWEGALRDLDGELEWEAAAMDASCRGAELRDITTTDLARWVDEVGRL